MRKKIDVMIGQHFGRWTVLEDLGGKQYRKLLCQCDCGTQRAVRLSHLSNGSSFSCDCFRLERARDRGGKIEAAQASLKRDNV